MKGWSDKLKELEALDKTRGNQNSQQVCLCMHIFAIASWYNAHQHHSTARLSSTGKDQFHVPTGIQCPV